jgi:WhiB family transcriptional regulator, redox-sensing transcriptional regulator
MNRPNGLNREQIFAAPWTPQQLPAVRTETWEWQLRARCRGYPSDVFYLDGLRGRELIRREQRAKRICDECPVLPECRAHALGAPEVWGIWGALTPAERNQLRG